MRTKVSPKLMELAHRVAGIPGMKKLLKPLYYPYKERINKNRNKVFREKALSVFKEFDNILISNNIHYSVFAGTLLGAVRERGFIKHDCDIDTCIWYKDYSPKLTELLVHNGFKLVRRFEVDGGKKACEETYQKDGIDIDVFFIYSDDKFPSYQCDFGCVEGTASHEESMSKYGFVTTRRIEFPVSYEVIRVPFETIEVNILSNAEEWLESRYGSDYMIPNPKFCDKVANPRMFKWEEVRATFWYDK